MEKTALLEEKTKNIAAARAIAVKAETEGRNFTDEERAQVSGFMEKARDAHNSILAIDGDAKMLDELNALGRPVGELAKGITGAAGAGVSLGDRFTKSKEIEGWLKNYAPNGIMPESTRLGASPGIAFDLKELGNRGTKALVTGGSDTSAGALVNVDRLGLQDLGTFQRPLTLRNLVTNGQTGTDAVEYARVTGFTNNAAPVPEATNENAVTADGAGGTATIITGGVKPKSGLTLEKVTANVKTLAHWIPATKRALSDASQIRTLIDNFLEYGLEEELEDQIANGDGTGENFEGVLHVAGTQAQAWDTDLFTTTRKARRKVRTVGRATPTAYAFNPVDNERIDLEKDGNERFFGNGPFGLGPDVLWGLPRIESEAIPAGIGIVGDWKSAILWDREQAAIQVSDAHEDFFIRNLVAILGEMRAAFGIIRPKAFVVIDLTA